MEIACDDVFFCYRIMELRCYRVNGYGVMGLFGLTDRFLVKSLNNNVTGLNSVDFKIFLRSWSI